MPVTTPNDLITLALKHAMVTGVGQTPLAENMNDALSVLNMMLGQWGASRWLVYHEVDVAAVSTGAQSYSIGPGGAFNVPRPDRLESAFARYLGGNNGQPVDHPMTLLSREDYNSISIKNLSAWPTYAFLDSGFPLGTLYVWPVPAATVWELHVTVKETLSAMTLSQTINLPAVYQEALLTNLAVRLRIQAGEAPDGSLNALARASLERIRAANTQIPTLTMPANLIARGRYNIYTDQVY